MKSLILIGLMASVNALAETESQKSVSSLAVNCARATDERKLTVLRRNPGCELYYEKFGVNQVVAHSENSAALCEKVKTNMQGNLEGSGFICK